jgi:hypothetical protein
MRTWKIGIFAVVLFFAVGTIVYALNTSSPADSSCQVSISSESGQEIQLSSDGCCPKKTDKGCPKKSEKGCPKKSEKGCPKEAEKGCPKKGSGCDKK